MTQWFPNVNAQKDIVVMVEMDGYDPSTATVKTLRFSNGRDVHSSNVVTDIPVRTYFPGRLINPSALTINLVEAWTKGLAPTGLSELQLSNSDKGLDHLRPWTFDGYPVRVYAATLDTVSTPQYTRTLLFSGKMEQPDISRRMVTVPLRNLSYALDKPARTVTFAGTGDSEGGVDVQGLVKPYVYGYAANVTCILLDAARLIYFISYNGTPQTTVRDAGVTLPVHSTQLTYAALKAVAVTAGQAAFFNGDVTTPGKYVKLGSTPVGQVTCDEILSTGTHDSTGSLVGCITQLMVDAGFFPIPNFINNIVYGITGRCGRYIKDDTTFLAILGDLISNYAGWIWYNPLGTSGTNPAWVLGQVPSTDTGGVTQVVITDADIIDMVRLGNPKTPGEGIPPQSITLECFRNETVQTSGLAAGAPVSWRNFAAREFRTLNRTDASVLTRYPLAQALKFTARATADTVNAPSVTALNAYWDALHLGYEFYSVTVKFKPALFQTYFDAGNIAWVPACMPAFSTHRLAIRTGRFGFLNTGRGTQVAPMNVLLDFERKRITYIVRTSYQAG